MIANVSPSGLSYEDTYNTLKYADRAKQIKTKVGKIGFFLFFFFLVLGYRIMMLSLYAQLVRNVVSVDFHVTKYKTIVIELTKEVSKNEEGR